MKPFYTLILCCFSVFAYAQNVEWEKLPSPPCIVNDFTIQEDTVWIATGCGIYYKRDSENTWKLLPGTEKRAFSHTVSVNKDLFTTEAPVRFSTTGKKNKYSIFRKSRVNSTLAFQDSYIGEDGASHGPYPALDHQSYIKDQNQFLLWASYSNLRSNNFLFFHTDSLNLINIQGSHFPYNYHPNIATPLLYHLSGDTLRCIYENKWVLSSLTNAFAEIVTIYASPCTPVQNLPSDGEMFTKEDTLLVRLDYATLIQVDTTVTSNCKSNWQIQADKTYRIDNQLYASEGNKIYLIEDFLEMSGSLVVNLPISIRKITKIERSPSGKLLILADKILFEADDFGSPIQTSLDGIIGFHEVEYSASQPDIKVVSDWNGLLAVKRYDSHWVYFDESTQKWTWNDNDNRNFSHLFTNENRNFGIKNQTLWVSDDAGYTWDSLDVSITDPFHLRFSQDTILAFPKYSTDNGQTWNEFTLPVPIEFLNWFGDTIMGDVACSFDFGQQWQPYTNPANIAVGKTLYSYGINFDFSANAVSYDFGQTWESKSLNDYFAGYNHYSSKNIFILQNINTFRTNIYLDRQPTYYKPDPCNYYIITSNARYDYPSKISIIGDQVYVANTNDWYRLNVCDIRVDSVLTARICDGDSVDFFGATFESNGTYEVFISDGTNACGDQRHVLDLRVDVDKLRPQTAEICNGDSILWRGNYYSESGIYMDPTNYPNYCDTIFSLELIVNPTFTTTLDTVFDIGSTHWGQVFNQSGLYTIPLRTKAGCDSTLVLNVVTDLEEVTNAHWTIAPNPTTDVLQVRLNGQPWVEGHMYTMEGILLQKVPLSGNIVSVLTTHLPQGMYSFTLLHRDGHRETKVFVKM